MYSYVSIRAAKANVRRNLYSGDYPKTYEPSRNGGSEMDAEHVVLGWYPDSTGRWTPMESRRSWRWEILVGASVWMMFVTHDCRVLRCWDVGIPVHVPAVGEAVCREEAAACGVV